MEKPLVSIIIPIYNSQLYIEDTVRSCLTQSYTHLEILLINDGSTDKTENIISQIKDDRIQYFKIANIGASNARNFGIEKAKGQLYQFLDRDDVLDSEKIINQVKLFQVHGDAYIYSGKMGAVSDKVRVEEQGYELYEKDFTPQQFFETRLNQFGKDITTGAWLVPQKLVQSTHGWDPEAGLNDDGEYFMRLILNSTGIIYSPHSVFYFRRDVPNSLSKQFNSKSVFIKWLYSYKSYAKHLVKQLNPAAGKMLAWKALSVYYCNAYPNYPDLLKECKAEMKVLGYNHPFPQGGGTFVRVAKILGVETTLKLWQLKSKVSRA